MPSRHGAAAATAAAFARRHGLRAKRLVWWSKRLAATATPVTVSFAPAVVASSDVVAVIRMPSGIAIELASATPAQIAAIASALMTRSA